MPGLLEVFVAHERDVPGAIAGGADRLALTHPTERGGMSPDVVRSAAVLRAATVPVRVMLRLNDEFSTTGGEFTRLIGLAEEYLSQGAEGVCFGFLTPDVTVDRPVCEALAAALPGVPWTFHRAIDAALSPTHAWRDVKGLPGLTAVRSGGSPLGLSSGYDDVLAAAERDPELAALVMPAGGLQPEQVPWLWRLGVSQFNVGRQVRPTGAFNAYVDADLVRGWRLLLDGLPAR